MKSYKSFWLVTFMVIVVSLSGCLGSGSSSVFETYNFTLVVKDSSGHPVVDASVSVVGSSLYTKKTDDQGTAQFTGLSHSQFSGHHCVYVA